MCFTFFILLMVMHDGRYDLCDGEVLPMACLVGALVVLEVVKHWHREGQMSVHPGGLWGGHGMVVIMGLRRMQGTRKQKARGSVRNIWPWWCASVARGATCFFSKVAV